MSTKDVETNTKKNGSLKELSLTEHECQCLVFEWAGWMKHKHPELGLLFSIPNQGGRGMSAVIRGRLMVAAGLKAGVPDIFLAVARQGKNGLFIELKRKRGGQARTGQREWLRALKAEGYEAVICKGADEAITIICEYLEVRDGG